jgi:hypothetical protein
LLGAEIDEVNAFGSSFDMRDFSRDAFGFADVVAGFLDGQAVGGEGRCCG